MSIKKTQFPQSEKASANAAEGMRKAQKGVETARESQLIEVMEMFAERQEANILKSLQSIFGENGDAKNPGEMKVLVQRIPILCTEINTIHKNIETINDNMKWAVRIVLGAVVLAVMKVILIP
jgi:flagellar hook-associated protein FlgK